MPQTPSTSVFSLIFTPICDKLEAEKGEKRMRLKTVRRYDFFEVSSSMQKALRRGDAKVAGYFALELLHSGYWKYVWKRLLTVSAEDCHGIVTKEIEALWNSFKFINEGRRKKDKGRIFLSKAVLILADVLKNRDADHLQNLVYDKKISITDEEIEEYFEDVRKEDYMPIPDYAYDVHTLKGKRMGMTKEQFFKDELKALKPRQIGLFDSLIE